VRREKPSTPRIGQNTNLNPARTSRGRL
jgi:hypothetical protein